MMNSILRRLPRRKDESSSCASSSSGSSSSSSSASSAGLLTPQWGALVDAPHVRDQVDQMDEDDTLHDPQEWFDSKGKQSVEGRRPGMFIELPAPPPLELPTAILSDTSVTPTRWSHLSRSASRTSTSSSATSRPQNGSDSTPRTGGTPPDQRMLVEEAIGQQTILFTSTGPEQTAMAESTDARARPTPTWLKSLASSSKKTTAKRPRRGRSRSIHLLWRSEVDEAGWQVLQQFHTWRTGNEWPEPGRLSNGELSRHLESIGL
ncbi:hypothetical protein ACM66B_002345 [Microbotryomycetes sp. NB124-2]